MSDKEAPPTSDFGELDGEPVKAIVVSISGSGHLERLPGDGERAIVSIEGTFAFKAVKRVNGKLVKEFAVKAERLAEPGGELADEVSAFLIKVDDEQKGRDQLPFDPETGEVKPDEDGEEPTDG